MSLSNTFWKLPGDKKDNINDIYKNINMASVLNMSWKTN